MKLRDFIEKFVEANSLVRLVYRHKGGHVVVGKDWNTISMDWEIVKSKGPFGKYANYEVVGVTDILISHGHYTEAINIVIKHV